MYTKEQVLEEMTNLILWLPQDGLAHLMKTSAEMHEFYRGEPTEIEQHWDIVL